MAIKIGLNERFRTINFLDVGYSPVERIGSLYYRVRQIDQSSARNQLQQALEVAETADPQMILMQLHSAIALAQNGRFEGIACILRLLHQSVRAEINALAETALRNCSQYPIAVLLGQALILNSTNLQDGNLRELLKLSDDDFFANMKEGVNQQDAFSKLREKIVALNGLPRKSGRELAIGTILYRPVKNDSNYRYSGFIALDREKDQKPFIVPYDLGDVLNRDDPQAYKDVWQLTRRPGHRTVVVYNTEEPYEVEQMYILPFAARESSDMVDMMGQLALGSDGLAIGVATEVQVDRGYRVITAEGHCRWEKYGRESKKIGSCIFIHKLNSSSLSSDLTVTPDVVNEVARTFQKRSAMTRAVTGYSFGNNGILLSALGMLKIKRDVFDSDTAYYVDQVIDKDGKKLNIPFNLPSLRWTPQERAEIVDAFFYSHPEYLGVVLESFEYSGGLNTRIVNPTTGEILIWSVREPVTAGTLALCTKSSDGKLFISVLNNYRKSGGCSACFGTTHRICTTCAGKGQIACPECHGTQKLQCPVPDCRKGKVTCGRCAGTGKCQHCTNGRWAGGRICKVCNGSGKCQKCIPAGSGLWNCATCHGQSEVFCHCSRGYVQCPTCNGTRISSCACKGQKQSQTISF